MAQGFWVFALSVLGFGCLVSNSLASAAFVVSLALILNLIFSHQSGFEKFKNSAWVLLYAAVTLLGLWFYAPGFYQFEAAFSRWFLLVSWLMVVSGAFLLPKISEKNIKLIELSVQAGVLVLWCTCIYQAYVLNMHRVVGFHRNPNFLAAALLPSIVYFGEKYKFQIQKTREFLNLNLLFLMLVVHTMLLTATRTTIPLVFVYLSFFGFSILKNNFKFNRKRVLWCAVFVLACIWALSFLPVWRRFDLVYMIQDPAILSRFEIWKINFQNFLEHPFLGVGFMQNYLSVEDYPSLQKYMGNEVRGLLAHNTFLQVAVESGVLGLASFVGVLLRAWYKFKSLRWHLFVVLVAGLADTMLHLNRAQPSILLFSILTLLFFNKDSD